MEEKPLRVVLLGKTGAGKSSLGNTLMGNNEFKVCHRSTSGTSKCQAATRGNGEIKVIDTPGFFDNCMDEKELKGELLRCIIEAVPGPHAFVILFKVDRYTQQESEVIKKIIECFSEEALKYAVLVFTHGDQLPDGTSITDFINDNKALQKLSDKCGGRCHVIDNRYWNNDQQDSYRSNQFQVRALLKTISELVRKNRGTCYTNPVLQKVEKKMKEEVDRTGSTEEAKENVFEFFLEKLSDLPFAAWLGILFGIASTIAAVLLRLK